MSDYSDCSDPWSENFGKKTKKAALGRSNSKISTASKKRSRGRGGRRTASPKPVKQDALKMTEGSGQVMPKPVMLCGTTYGENLKVMKEMQRMSMNPGQNVDSKIKVDDDDGCASGMQQRLKKTEKCDPRCLETVKMHPEHTALKFGGNGDTDRVRRLMFLREGFKNQFLGGESNFWPDDVLVEFLRSTKAHQIFVLLFASKATAKIAQKFRNVIGLLPNFVEEVRDLEIAGIVNINYVIDWLPNFKNACVLKLCDCQWDKGGSLSQIMTVIPKTVDVLFYDGRSSSDPAFVQVLSAFYNNAMSRGLSYRRVFLVVVSCPSKKTFFDVLKNCVKVMKKDGLLTITSDYEFDDDILEWCLELKFKHHDIAVYLKKPCHPKVRQFASMAGVIDGVNVQLNFASPC